MSFNAFFSLSEMMTTMMQWDNFCEFMLARAILPL